MRPCPGACFLRVFRSTLPAFLALAASAAASAQTPLVTAAHTVTALSQPPAVEHDFTVTAAGSYTVTLTDLGSKLTSPLTPAPLASVSMAVTHGASIVGTPVTSPGTPITFNATSNTTYTIHVVGLPGTQVGSGPIEEDVTDANSNKVFTSIDTLSLPSQQPGTIGILVDDLPPVPSTGSYTVSLTDLAFPAALQAAALLLVDNTTSTSVVLQNPPSNSFQDTVTLTAGDSYQMIAYGLEAPAASGGLFGIAVTSASGPPIYPPKLVPIGLVKLLQTSVSGQAASSFTLGSGGATLSLADLSFPTVPLSQVGAAIVDANTQTLAAPAVRATGTQSFTPTSTSDTYQVYAYAVPDSTANDGSYSVSVQQGTAFPFLEAQAVSSSSVIQAFSFDTQAPAAGSYVFTLTDFKFPAALTADALIAVQNGQLVKAINAAGNFTAPLAQGPVSLLAFGQEASSPGLMGIDVSPSSGGAATFDATEGVGTGFSSNSFTVSSAQAVQANVADLKFPAALANLDIAVTSGTSLVGSISSAGSSGSFPFQAAANATYNVNVLAQPAPPSGPQPESAGTYAMSVEAAPVVSLTPSSTSVTSGGTVTLTWTSQNATTCTASASPANSAWSGSESPSGGPVTSSAITAMTTFSLSCTGGGGTGSASATVNVTAASSSGGGGHGGGGAFDPELLLALAALLALRMKPHILQRIRRMSTVRTAAVSVLLLVAILSTGCTGAQGRHDSYISRGQEYFDKGDYARASIEFRNAMQVMPKDPKARLLEGEAAERLGQYRAAAGLFQSVIESNPDNVRARVDLGQIFDFGGVPQRALKLIAPALARHPNDASLLTVRGMARAQLKDYPGALADAQRAVELDPTYEQAVGLLAALYRSRNEDAQAVSLVEKTLQRLPHSMQLREVLAGIYAQAGDEVGAEKQLQMLIAARPAELRYRAQLAQVEVRASRLDQAEAVLRAAVEALPKSDDAKLLLVSFLTDHRSVAQSDAALRSFIAAEPDDARLRLALGAALESRGQASQALDVYAEVVRRDGDAPDALIARDQIAAIEMSGGHSEEAAAQVATVLKVDPGNDAALMTRGNLQLANGHPTAAITDFRAVLRDEPGFVQAHRLAARALIASGDVALAEDQLQTAIQIAPGDANTRLELAQIYLQAGAADRAVSVLEQGVLHLPTDGPLREALTQAYIAKGDFQSAATQADGMAAALPDSGAGPYLQGVVAAAQKRYAPAEADFVEALRRQPRAIKPLVDLTRLELSRHEDAKAAERLRRLVQGDPTNGLALELLGEIDLAGKAYPQAIAEFSQAIKVAPVLWYAYRNLAVAKADNGDMAGSVAAYQAGIKAAPDQPELVAELASYDVRQQQPDDAIALYETLYQHTPGSAAAASYLALLLATYRSDRPSLERARQLSARFATSNDGALLDTSGWVLFKSGDLQQALPLLHRAQSRDPGSGLIRYHVGVAELQAGDRARAQADLKAALAGSQAFPGMSDAREKLASLQANAG